MTDTTGFIDLFVNDNPEGNRPHFKGFVKINGEKLEFACWPAKSGKPGVYSGKVQPERAKAQASAPQHAATRRPAPNDDLDDQSIPF